MDINYSGDICIYSMCSSYSLQYNNYSPDGAAYLLDVVNQRVSVLLPVGLECVLIGELVTTELQSDLKAVAAEVVEILHSCNG